MFDAVVGSRQRKVWSPATVALSFVAHVVLLGAAVAFSTREAPATPTEEVPIAEWDIPPEEVTPEPTPPVDAPVQPDEPAVEEVRGQTVVIPEVTEVPVEIPKVNPNETPLLPEHVTGQGITGNTFDPNATEQAVAVPPAPPSTPEPPTAVSVEVVEVRPEIANRREVERMLERSYPPLMRDAGVTARVVVQMIIDEEGRVEPGSVAIQSATHDGFRDASVRAAEKFRFRPARLNGRAVPVIIAIPIDWKLDH